MIVVAGPPGSGKTSSFPVTAFGVDGFNIDDRCAQILGSYRAIPRHVRRAVAKSASGSSRAASRRDTRLPSRRRCGRGWRSSRRTLREPAVSRRSGLEQRRHKVRAPHPLPRSTSCRRRTSCGVLDDRPALTPSVVSSLRSTWPDAVECVGIGAQALRKRPSRCGTAVQVRSEFAV